MTAKFKFYETFFEVQLNKRENAPKQFEPYQFCYLKISENPTIRIFITSMACKKSEQLFFVIHFFSQCGLRISIFCLKILL